MSLTAAIRTAQGALHTTSAQTAITSRNVANASDPGYTRKTSVVSNLYGGAQALSIRRAFDKALYNNMIGATSVASAQQALVDGLKALGATTGDPQDGRSPAALIGALNDALQLYSATPSDLSLAQSAIAKANALARSLNEATAAVQNVRRQADEDMATSVDSLNSLLADFEAVNSEIVIGTHSGADVTDKLDTRDKLLSQISELIGVNMVTRGDNDAVLYTDSGVTLFETTARPVTFVASTGLNAASTGSAVFVDGVAVTGSAATMPIRSGRLQGLATLRDETAVTYQTQLDEIARGLINAFAESDQTVPATLPDAAGLFTYPGGPALPGASWVPGLGGSIQVNANVDPARGGNLALLRDGGISNPLNPAYKYNTTNAAGYSDRLLEYLDKLTAEQSFDPAAELGSPASMGKFSAASVSWLESARKEATNAANYSTTLVAHASDALSNATGVNLDDEMALLLEFEKSYQASAKLLAVIDEMLASLIATIR
jgi:flagellar hook-associated protein 1